MASPCYVTNVCRTVSSSYKMKRASVLDFADAFKFMALRSSEIATIDCSKVHRDEILNGKLLLETLALSNFCCFFFFSSAYFLKLLSHPGSKHKESDACCLMSILFPLLWLVNKTAPLFGPETNSH